MITVDASELNKQCIVRESPDYLLWQELSVDNCAPCPTGLERTCAARQSKLIRFTSQGETMNATLKAVSLGAATLALAACSHVTEREVVHDQPVAPPAPIVEHVSIVQQPAAPVEQIPSAPSAGGSSWVGGHYAWRSDHWEWESGQWIAGNVRPNPPLLQETPPPAPSSGARWIPGYWAFYGTDWTWTRGHWE
jgi:hypothetical protein